MQQYFFPYLDDVSCWQTFMSSSFTTIRNRQKSRINRILKLGGAAYLTLPVAGVSHRRLICERRLHEPHRHQRKLFARMSSGSGFIREKLSSVSSR